MRDTIKNALQKIQNIFGTKIFAEPERFKAALSDILCDSDDSEIRKARNLLNIAVCDMKAYSRLELEFSSGNDFIISNLATTMNTDYMIDYDSAQIVINCIAELVGYKISVKNIPSQSFLKPEKNIITPSYLKPVKHTDGIKGTVVACGRNDSGQCDVQDWRDIIAVAAGSHHTVGLTQNGKVLAVGFKRDGQCNVSDWQDIIAIAAGDFYTLGIKHDGTVIATGFNSKGKINKGKINVSNWRDIVSIATGLWHTLGLKRDGTVIATGDNGLRRCNVSEWRDIVHVAAGLWSSSGIKADGTVVATGLMFDKNELSHWRDIVQVVMRDYDTIGLKSDGTVISHLYNDEFSSWRNIVAVSVGESHIVGLRADGTVLSVGYGTYGNEYGSAMLKSGVILLQFPQGVITLSE